MSQESNIQEKDKKPFPKKTVLLAIVIGIAIAIAVICFALVIILPQPKGPLLKNPLRSLLTGLGLLGVACPLCIFGSILGKRATKSPYFEEAFIATVLNVFGFLCSILGLICIGLSIFALVKRVLGSG
jgi:multisubunit Na+/H+ antiporter MnhC subunit